MACGHENGTWLLRPMVRISMGTRVAAITGTSRAGCQKASARAPQEKTSITSEDSEVVGSDLGAILIFIIIKRIITITAHKIIMVPE